MKGLSFNINLSEEQMDHIAALAADKIQYTINRMNLTYEKYDSEIRDLKRKIEKRDSIIVEKELKIQWLNEIIERQKAKLIEM